MKKILLLYITLFSFISNAQNFEWAKGFVGGYNTPNDILADNNNNSYIVGTYRGIVDFDPSNNVLNNVSTIGGGYIEKLNFDGTIAWVVRFESIDSLGIVDCRSIAIEDDSFVYVVGNFKGSVDFNPNNGSSIVTSQGDYYNSFITKLNLNGDVIWTKFLVGTGGVTSTCIEVKDGMIFIGGSFYGIIDFNPSVTISTNFSGSYNSTAFLLKLSNSGEYKWFKKNMTNNIFSRIFVSDLNIDDFGNVYTVGGIEGSVSFEDTIFNTEPYNGVSTVNFYQDVYIKKVDTSGAYEWVKRFDGDLLESFTSITSDNKGSVYLTGHQYGGMDFDPSEGEVLMSDLGNHECFVLKMDSLGNYIWVKAFGGNDLTIGSRIELDTFNNVYTIGMYRSDFDVNPGSDTEILEAGGGYNFFLQKLDESGNFVWGKGIKSIPIANYGFTYYSIFVNDNLNIFTCGGFRDSLDLNPDIGEAFLVSDSNNYSSFIQKFNQCGPSLGVDNQVACFEYKWINDSTYSGSISGEVYTLINQAVTGCDSIVTLNLVIDIVNNSIVNNNSMLSSDLSLGEYQWFDCENGSIIDGAVFQNFTPLINGNYSVIIEENGCIDTSNCVTVDNLIEEYLSGVGVPQAFSPNNDGNNDVLLVKGNGISSLTFNVFNRYGELVFQSQSQNIGWDGLINGQIVNPGVFVWTLNCVFLDGTSSSLKGNVTLLK